MTTMDASSPNDIRSRGWTVAVHNDYSTGGRLYTFWLFTKAIPGIGTISVKGEGPTDGEALDRVRAEIEAAESIINSRDERQRVAMGWAIAAFGKEQTGSKTQRALRLLEEAMELFQAADGDAAMAHKLVDYVFAREKGSIFQELGGVALTTLVFAEACRMSADTAERTELARVLAKPVAHFAQRNDEKNRAGFIATERPPRVDSETGRYRLEVQFDDAGEYRRAWKAIEALPEVANIGFLSGNQFDETGA